MYIALYSTWTTDKEVFGVCFTVCCLSLLMRDLTPALLLFARRRLQCVSGRGVVCSCRWIVVCVCVCMPVRSIQQHLVSSNYLPSSTACWSAAAAAFSSDSSSGDVWVESPPGSPAAPTAASSMDRIGVSFLDPLEDYELIHRIGCGTYGDVFKVSENVSWCFSPSGPVSWCQCSHTAACFTSCHHGETLFGKLLLSR